MKYLVNMTLKYILIKKETALLAKEKGIKQWYPNGGYEFDNGGLSAYYTDNKVRNCLFNPNHVIAIAFTQFQLMKILIDSYKIYPMIIPTICGYWTYKIIDIQCDPEHQIERPPYKEVNENDYNSFEEAMEFALLESLNKIIK